MKEQETLLHNFSCMLM